MKLPQTIEDKIRLLNQNQTYLNLPTPKRLFIRAYIENGGDQTKAAFATNDMLKSEQAAMNKGYKYLTDPVIVGLLRSFGDPGLNEPLVTNKELQQMTSQRLRDKSISTTDFLKLIELYQTMVPKKANRKAASLTETVLEMEKQQ